MKRRVERLLKTAGIALLRLAAPRSRGVTDQTATRSWTRILVLKPDERLGNTVLVTSLLLAIREQWPDARLVCMISRRYEALSEYLPAVDHCILFDKHLLARRPWKMWSVLSSLRQERFDCVFDASGDHEVSFTHLVLCVLSGARCRIGHARGGVEGMYEVAVPIPDGPRHAAEMHCDLLNAIAPISDSSRPRLRVSHESSKPVWDGEYEPWVVGRPVIVIHPGARGRKQWPPDQFAAVLNELHDRNTTNLALVWGPSDKAVASEVLRRVPPSVRALGVLSFPDLISVLRHSAVFVSADCGPMHLAAAVGIPVVAIFLASDMEKYAPLGSQCIALDGRAVAPSPQTVVENIENILSCKDIEQSNDMFHHAPGNV